MPMLLNPFWSAGGGGPSAPVTGMTLWLRGDHVTLNSTTVSSWNDQSGNGFNYTQGTALLQPTYSATGGPNSTPILGFDGASTFLAGNPAAWSSLIANNACTTYLIWNAAAGGTDDVQGSASNKRTIFGDDQNYMAYSLGATKTWMSNFNGATYNNNQVAFSTATWYGSQLRHDSGTWYELLSGTAEASTASGNTSNLTRSPSVGFDGQLYFSGSMAEIIIYNTALSATDRATNQSYLHGRYGITW